MAYAYNYMLELRYFEGKNRRKMRELRVLGVIALFEPTTIRPMHHALPLWDTFHLALDLARLKEAGYITSEIKDGRCFYSLGKKLPRG